MKKSPLLNSHLSALTAKLGHTDEITVCDCGLPIPSQIERIDLALTYGVPSFLQTVSLLLNECQFEGVILAEEFAQASPDCHAQLLAYLEEERVRTGKIITVSYIAHEDFKIRTQQSRAVIRTGECTAYANVIFQSGVVF